MIKLLLFAVAQILVAATTVIAGDAAAGKALYATCVACHKPNGEGMKALGAPNLTGQHDWYARRQIKDFKDGIRGSHPKDIFGQQSRPMKLVLPTDKAVDDVVAYISSLPFKPSPKEIQGDANKGKVK